MKLLKVILDSVDPKIGAKIIANKINMLNEENVVIVERKNLLSKYLLVLISMEPLSNSSEYLVHMKNTLALQIISKNNTMGRYYF